MADGIYIGMAAAAGRALELDAVADNLANVETPGFKAARPAFQAFYAPGGRGETDKVFTAAVATGIDRSPGVTITTDSPMDVVPDGDLLLGVQTPGGALAYTRNGRLEVSADGDLMIAGLPVVGKTGQPIIVPPGGQPTVQPTGEVFVDGAPIDSLGLFRVDGPVERDGRSMLIPGPGAQVQTVDDGKVRVGELELANVTALESTVALISAQRHFDTAMQAIQTYRKLDEKAVDVGRSR
jgi:flagellar basal-body rod protein FlgF